MITTVVLHRSQFLLMDEARPTSCFRSKIRETNLLPAVASYLLQRYESCVHFIILTWLQVQFTECQTFALKVGKAIPENDS